MTSALALPHLLGVRGNSITLRHATERDLDALIALLADDPISAARGDRATPGDRSSYLAAFRSISADPANALLVADSSSAIVATMQLTVIPGLARRGATRLQVEGVRVASAQRSSGIGSAMMRWVTDVAAPALGASLVQLTSDAERADAHRFYTRLGFVASHVGFKFRR